MKNQMRPGTFHEWAPVNRKRQTAVAKDETFKAIQTIATTADPVVGHSVVEKLRAAWVR